MAVQLFGAASPPGCANFALKTTADDKEAAIGSAAAEFLCRNFYIDHGLKSVASIQEAVELVKEIKEMCKRGGFHLQKFTSNRKEVIEVIVIEVIIFKFMISLKDRPCTQRGILSTISSIFDPLRFVAPLLLEGKTILQEL